MISSANSINSSVVIFLGFFIVITIKKMKYKKLSSQIRNFKKLVGIIDCKSTKIVKESELKRGTPEYQVSLVLDNLLNIERRRIK